MTAQANTATETNTDNDDFSFSLKLGKTGRRVAAGVGATLVVGAALYTAHRLGYLPNPFGKTAETSSPTESAPAA